ncbi:hypothetical protein PULV_b0617 [Pseudoalteromonas ulvae UL12]|nr:hypothetical protein [Pseudoalteromonas ulvae UL12]
MILLLKMKKRASGIEQDQQKLEKAQNIGFYFEVKRATL